MFKTIFKAPINLFNRYNSALLRSPYKTKMATAGTTYFLADCICQNYIERRETEHHNFARSARQAGVGALFAAPSLHVWHSMILPKLVKNCTGFMTRLGISVFLNETILAAYFISVVLFSFEALKNFDTQAGVDNVKEKFVPALETSVKFWTPISIINYGLMPVHLRPVFVSCFSVVWQSYLSYVANNKVVTMPEALEKAEEEVELELINKKGLQNYISWA